MSLDRLLRNEMHRFGNVSTAIRRFERALDPQQCVQQAEYRSPTFGVVFQDHRSYLDRLTNIADGRFARVDILFRGEPVFIRMTRLKSALLESGIRQFSNPSVPLGG